jgi:hypothetical protein
MRKLLKQSISTLFLTIFSLLIAQYMMAQPNTLYFMNSVHQADNLNPAVPNCCNGFYSIPVISGLYGNIANSGFDYDDLIHPGTGNMSDSLIIDILNVKNKLGKKNYLITDLSIPIFGFGFLSGNSFLSFEISNKVKLNVSYPENLVSLTDGNASFIGEKNAANINQFGPDLINYYEFAFGWSRQITSKLRLGAKLKVLSGIAAIKNKQSDFKLVTADTTYAMRLETNLNYNISLPVEFSYDENGLIDSIDYNSSNVVSDISPNRNFGLAIDFGAVYQLNDKFKLYGSITDLGFIRWGKFSNNIFQKGVFDYSGLSLDSVFNNNSDYNEFSAWGDSLKDFFHFNHSENKFTTFLNANAYIGATYDVAKFLNFGFLSRTSYYNRSIHQAFTLSANFKPVNSFSASISYSIMNREYKNLGLGLAYRLGPMQLYLITDNLYTSFMPKNSKVYNFMLGFNMVFGCNKQDNYTMLGDSEELM